MAADYLELIQQAVDYIEDNVTNELTLSNIANEVGLSMFHFHRVFQSIVGESPCDYLRRRRLTSAAQQLLDTNGRILDIALKYQFGSQEAFTRSFKSMFGLTPGVYRRSNQPLLIEKPRLTPDKLDYLVNGLSLEPRIVEQKESTVTGIKCCSSFNKNYTTELWTRFVARSNEIQHKSTPVQFVGIYEYLSNVGFSCNTQFCYIASTLVGDSGQIPNNMISKTIPPATYAVFNQKESLVSREDAYRYIIGTWFPKSGYELAELDTLEVFNTGAPTDPSPECEICIPIK